ncbi:hypothetical protein F5880DRAFT_1536939 [Lentinula raphanica]|nr:hypothetical protein F5880DRAFT_1536939 [Lentinula raphanica]
MSATGLILIHHPLQEMIRDWLNEIMGGRNLLEENVTQDEAATFAQQFKSNPLARPCGATPEEFRYWIAGGPRSEWNKGASYVFVEILQKKKLVAQVDTETRAALREAFLVRLKTLHKYWLQNRNMQEDDVKDPKQALKRWQRKNTLFQQRREVILALRPLVRYVKVFDELGVAGMSSDEEDPGMRKPRIRYIIQEPRWRSAEVKNWVRLLDYTHLEGRCSNEGGNFGFTRGAPPRLRVDNSDKTSNRKYVAGLPSNFYDAQWLEAQEPGWSKGGSGFVNELICPQKPMQLSFPPELLKVLHEREYPNA